MPDVVMPRLSDSMEEGTIVRWLKADGEQVARGEELVEIETDKASMTYEAAESGTLETIARPGDTLPIGEVIARLGEAPVAAVAVAPAARAEAPPATPPAAPVAVAESTALRSPPAANGGESTRIKASPVARRMARELGVELAALEGSGPGGRIVKADVEAAEGPREAAAATPEPTGAKGTPETRELSRTQQVIARRMAEAKATVPEFTLTAEIDMGRAVAMRSELAELAGPGGDPAPSVNDMVVKACALALRDHPRANGAYRDGRFELYDRVNVGIAVATDDALVVPTIFDADRQALGEIAKTARALAERVRAKEVTPPELSGATFTVSNLGMFGVTSFTAVINPPQAAILAVGAVREAPIVRDGTVQPGHLMSVTLACDHRILYGADAARFLARVRELLEQPLGLAM